MRTSRIAITSACCIVILLGLRQMLDTDLAKTRADEPPAKQTQDADTKLDDRVVGIPIDGAKQQKNMLPYMHAKLRHSQQVFAGLVTKDFEKIELSAEALMLTSLSTPKLRLKPDRNRNDEVFDHLKLEFVRLSGQLKQMASNENLEGAAYVSENLNSTCIACHQYLRDELPRIPGAVQHAN